MFALIFNTNQEWSKGPDTGLSVFPALMFDGVWSKVEHDSFVFFGIILENGFKTLGGSINNTIFLVFLTVLINDTEIFKKPGDNFRTSFTRNVVFDINTFILPDFELSWERFPELNCLDTVVLILDVFYDWLQKFDESVHVGFQMFVTDSDELVEDLKTKVAVFFLIDNLDCLVDEIVAVLGIAEDIWHWTDTISQSLEGCFDDYLVVFLKAQQNTCQYQLLNLSGEYELFLVFETFANESKSENGHLLD